MASFRIPVIRAAVLMAAVVALSACGSGSVTRVSTGDPAGPPVPERSSPTSAPAPTASTTTAPFVQTAAQKPCVAVADPLPKGAPNVPVKVGPAPTSLVIEDLTPGSGGEVKAASSVTVDYVGVACSTGKIFDSSYKTAKPATFSLGQVIKGWSQGLLGMKVGGRRLLGIPSDIGYGAQGSPPDIGPNETLWFVVDLKSIT